jgi:hypothetical protein
MGSVCERPKYAQKKIFFLQESTGNKYKSFSFKDMKTKVKLEFEIENIEINHKYQLEAKFLEGQTKVFTTETVKSHYNRIIFSSCYICDYFFEKRQNLEISLIKDSKRIGTIHLPLGQIIGSPGSTFKQLIDKNSFIIITAQGINNSNSYLEFNFSTQCISHFDFSKLSEKISYLVTSNGKKLYSSESISNNGQFEPIKIPAALLEHGFTVSFLDCFQESLIFKNESIQSFTTPNQNVYLGLTVYKKQLNIINNSRFFRDISFIDYIKNGVTIKLNIGIDFTASNNPPNDPKSLHYLFGDYMNDYEQAISQCGMIVAYYDYNQSFPVYGFGAVIGRDTEPNMCFNINFKDNPEIQTIENVIKEYRNCFKNIQLAGPTKFCPMIKNVINNIKAQNNPLKYHILLLLTDGIILDMQETIDALVEGSFLPLSVIIIGIGNDHFQEMIILDGDNVPLVSSSGVKRMRDLVQFVPFNKFRHNPTQLAEQVLEEVPRQIIEYYSMNNIYPENLSMARLNNGPMMSNSQQNSYQPNFNQSKRINYKSVSESDYRAGGGKIYY